MLDKAMTLLPLSYMTTEGTLKTVGVLSHLGELSEDDLIWLDMTGDYTPLTEKLVELGVLEQGEYIAPTAGESATLSTFLRRLGGTGNATARDW